MLWAGDSRVYRWRAGRLEQLTRDHSVAAEGGRDGLSETQRRHTGGWGSAALALDLHRDQVQPGDRFLLCSDGLTRSVPDVADSGRGWQNPDIRAAVDGADRRRRLQAGAPGQRHRAHRRGVCGCALSRR